MNYYSTYYDGLFLDKEALNRYVEFFLKQGVQAPLLDCACGTGDLAIQLQQIIFPVDGLDIDPNMLKKASDKGINGRLIEQDMSKTWTFSNCYHTIVCIGDSINYLSESSAVQTFFNEAYNHLHDDGLFIFDMHSQDRLTEFQEEYIEDAVVNGMDIQWSVLSRDNQLFYQFAYYEEDYPIVDEIVQTVFEPETIEGLLEKIGFRYQVITDFNNIGYQGGEKYFYICRKE